MRFRPMNRAALAVALGLAFSAAPAFAQLAVPAETPPAGYDGVEYVDSAGCVFARIDVGGRVEWVPRVGPDRQQLCGMEPSVAVVAAPEPVIEPVPVTEPVIEASMPAPAPQPVAPPRTAMRTMASMPAPPPPMVVAAPVQLVPVQVILPDTLPAPEVALAAPCPDPSSIAAQYLENSIVPGCTTARAPSPDVVYGTDHPRPRPNHSPIARLRVDRPSPPPGYAHVWTDGRLNPYRGIRTVEGDAQMRMVWTDTVPRRLVASE
jgi:hypothetical protein